MKNKLERFFRRTDKRHWKFVRNLIYSRVILFALLIIIQLFLFFLVILRLEPYSKYFLGDTYGISILFMIYLANSPGKNEFKIAWLIPVLFLPIFGISFYIFFHTNRGGRTLSKSIKKVKTETAPLLLSDTSLITSAQPDKPSENNLSIKSAQKHYPETADFSSYMELQGHYPSYENTRVKYYPSGECFQKDLIEDLKNAKQFIFIEFFIINADESWLEIVDVLREKISGGVEVRVLFDAIGSVFSATKTHLKFLKSMGINAKIFLPLVPFFATHQNNRDHRKIVVIDGDVAFTGGVNISNEYFNFDHSRFDYWKDTAVRIKGPAIKTFTTMFLQNWNLFSRTPENYAKYIDLCYKNEDSTGMVIPYGDDAFNKEDIAENTYIYILGKAQKYVHITTPYLLIDNTMMNSLTFAAKRGIDVSIIVPSKPDHFITFCIGKIFMKQLIESGVNVYLYEDGFIHAKMFVSDDRLATVGSVNLDYRSFYHHFECGLFMNGSEAISDIEKDFQETLNHCTKMTSESYKKLPLRIKFVGYIFKIFAPLM